MDRHTTNKSGSDCGREARRDTRGGRGTPGRHDEPRSRPNLTRNQPPPQQNLNHPVLRTPIATALREMLGPMRWLGAPKGSDLSEALGGMPGDAGWLLRLPNDGGLLCITISRRLGPAQEETRVVLFQELRGHGGFTWCLAADDPSTLERVKAEIRSLLEDGAVVLPAGLH